MQCQRVENVFVSLFPKPERTFLSRCLPSQLLRNNLKYIVNWSLSVVSTFCLCITPLLYPPFRALVRNINVLLDLFLDNDPVRRLIWFVDIFPSVFVNIRRHYTRGVLSQTAKLRSPTPRMKVSLVRILHQKDHLCLFLWHI